eukprot:scaffold4206_cov137-Skeletonema_menzelii.AAC.3
MTDDRKEAGAAHAEYQFPRSTPGLRRPPSLLAFSSFKKLPCLKASKQAGNTLSNETYARLTEGRGCATCLGPTHMLPWYY